MSLIINMFGTEIMNIIKREFTVRKLEMPLKCDISRQESSNSLMCSNQTYQRTLNLNQPTKSVPKHQRLFNFCRRRRRTDVWHAKSKTLSCSSYSLLCPSLHLFLSLSFTLILFVCSPSAIVWFSLTVCLWLFFFYASVSFSVFSSCSLQTTLVYLTKVKVHLYHHDCFF